MFQMNVAPGAYVIDFHIWDTRTAADTLIHSSNTRRTFGLQAAKETADERLVVAHFDRSKDVAARNGPAI